MENQPPIQNNIFLSGSLCVELYSHCLLCCREKVCVRVVFGRAYHWVISSISKQSTSTDVAILVNVIPAWQHTPRKQPSQTEYFFCFVHHRACNQLWNTDISGLTVHYTASVSEWSGKKRWRWNEHSINIQTIVFAQSTDGEPERCWSSGWCWSQHVTEMKKNTAVSITVSITSVGRESVYGYLWLVE